MEKFDSRWRPNIIEKIKIRVKFQRMVKILGRKSINRYQFGHLHDDILKKFIIPLLRSYPSTCIRYSIGYRNEENKIVWLLKPVDFDLAMEEHRGRGLKLFFTVWPDHDRNWAIRNAANRDYDGDQMHYEDESDDYYESSEDDFDAGNNGDRNPPIPIDEAEEAADNNSAEFRDAW